MRKVFLILAFLVLGLGLGAQTLTDYVHLKNGSIIKGIIIEQIPGESLKIQTPGGSVFVFRMDEIEKITKEAAAPTSSGYSPSLTNPAVINRNPYSHLTVDGDFNVRDADLKIVSWGKVSDLLGQENARQLEYNKKAFSRGLPVMLVGEVVSLLSIGLACAGINPGWMGKSPNSWLTPLAGVSTLGFLSGINTLSFYGNYSTEIINKYNGIITEPKPNPGDRKLTLFTSAGIGFMYADYLSSSPDDVSYFESLGIDPYNKAGFSIPLNAILEYRPWEDKSFIVGGGLCLEYSASGFGGTYYDKEQYIQYKILDATDKFLCYGAEGYVGFQTINADKPFIYGKLGVGIVKLNAGTVKAKIMDSKGKTISEKEKEMNMVSDWKARPFAELGFGRNFRYGVRYSPIFGSNGFTSHAWQIVFSIPVNISNY